MTERGPNDLEQQIEALQKQKIYLQRQCRKAGETILAQEKLNDGLKKDIDRLAEENNNLLTMYAKE
tara:strand:+ start:184 stop:381 length:198 start_codon:yes stop_codon:yes gene_type:complete